MTEQVPGFVVRDGDILVGFRCPISHRLFRGIDGERKQYRHTRQIMANQPPRLTIAERREQYIQFVQGVDLSRFYEWLAISGITLPPDTKVEAFSDRRIRINGAPLPYNYSEQDVLELLR